MDIKECITCHTILSLECFSKNKTKKDGLQQFCKNCANEKSKEDYQKHKEKRKTSARGYKTKVITHYKSLKIGKSCCVCGESAVECLDFHHKNASLKEFNVSAKYQFLSTEKMDREIEKCVILCSNCHRKLHAGTISLD